MSTSKSLDIDDDLHEDHAEDSWSIFRSNISTIFRDRYDMYYGDIKYTMSS